MGHKRYNLVIGVVLATLLCTLVWLSTSRAAKADEVEVYGGHWSTHLSSDDVTNEEHRWIGLRYNRWTAGYFRNSYGLDSAYVGYIGEIPLGGNVPDGRVILRGSVGAVYGYTRFYGHEPGANKKVLPYAIGGLLYQKNWWEVGAYLFGDAVIPSVGARYEF